MSEIRPPAPRPCESCPYRTDVPSGVWSEDEYAKLPAYDNETGFQTPAVFMCHQQDERMCAGWTATHANEHNLGMRIALLNGSMTVETFDAACDYVSPVPLFKSGQEAHNHGVAGIDAPDADAIRIIEKVERKL